jgi:uncharacterized protein (TIGR00369 family)
MVEASEQRAHEALDVPLLKFVGARFGGWDGGCSVVRLDVGPHALNANDRLHGGVLSMLLDVAAYLALLPTLKGQETAVTHSMSTMFMGACAANDALHVRGRVLQQGRSLAFIESEALVGERRVALATVCKSLLVLR